MTTEIRIWAGLIAGPLVLGAVVSSVFGRLLLLVLALSCGFVAGVRARRATDSYSEDLAALLESASDSSGVKSLIWRPSSSAIARLRPWPRRIWASLSS